MQALTVLFILMAAANCVDAQKPPDILAPPIIPNRPFPGWDALKGRVVVIDFWGTWCGPCLPSLQKLRDLQSKFSGRPVSFLTVARDEPERVKKFFADHGFDFPTYVEDDPRVFGSWGVVGVPATGIVLSDGNLLGVSPADNVTAEFLERLLNGDRPQLPPFERDVNFDWDRDEVQWMDGVRPDFLIVIKPTMSVSGGYLYEPGSNRISGDGVNLINLITAAWQTDLFHLNLQISNVQTEKFRYVATVPIGREATLLPALQDVIRRHFGLRISWREEERDVLVLKSAKPLERSSSEALFTSMRGTITLRGQPMTKLAAMLPNYMRKVVVDETGLDGSYDLTLSYRGDKPQELIDELNTKYGLTLHPAKRRVWMLLVEFEN